MDEQKKEAIEQLKKAIEGMVKMEIKIPKQFDYLRDVIFNRTGEYVSPTTLKRMWGYVKEPLETRTSTLSILAKSLGYVDWEDYLERFGKDEGKGIASSPVLSRSLSVASDLRPGDRIKLFWSPGRECVVRLREDSRFEVEQSENTRLQPGDTFQCHLIVDGTPLYLSGLVHGDNPPVAYVCGLQTGGVHFEKMF